MKPARRRRSDIRLLLIMVLMLTGAFIGAVAVAEVKGKTDAPRLTVRLVIDYNDGVQKHFTAIGWRKGMTVLDVLESAQQMRHGIQFRHTGSDETAFLTQIDDLKNESGAGGRNWLYWVNTEFADKGLGARTIEPADVILWKHDTWPKP